VLGGRGTLIGRLTIGCRGQMDVDGAAGGERSGAAPRRHVMVDYASIRRQEQIMLWVRACHRAMVLTFSTLHGPGNSPPLTAGTEPLGEAEPPQTNNFIWQEENSSIRIRFL